MARTSDFRHKIIGLLAASSCLYAVAACSGEDAAPARGGTGGALAFDGSLATAGSTPGASGAAARLAGAGGAASQNGQAVDAAGNVVDAAGNVVDAAGNVVVAAGSTAGSGAGSVNGGAGAVAGGASAVAQTGGAGALEEEADAVARPGLAARLSKVEYAYSVLDVLNVELTPRELDASEGGLPDDSGDGVFKHFADKQTSVEQHATAYFDIARTIADRTDVGALATQYDVCTDATDECGEAFIAAAGRRLFRRALTERELGVFASVYLAAIEEGSDFEGGAGWALQALLQAPQFLFRMDDEVEGVAGEDRDRTSVEVAARLASFLWVSVPDEDLLSAAAAGTLNDPAALTAQVTRMLADPKAERLTSTFISDYSRARLASFEGATDELREALDESVRATFQYHLWEAGRSLAELFTTTEFMLNASVAELLGAEHSGSGLELYDVSQLPDRAGILSHPAMIAGMGDRGTGSFVNRGKYLMERLLCRNPVAVPVDLDLVIEDFNAETTGFNEHERVAERMKRPGCWGCHTQFEPLAFGFSRYDAAGRYRGDVDVDGKPLTLAGWVPTGPEADSAHYETVVEYMQLLAAEKDVQRCMTEHFISFAAARGTDAIAKAHAELVSAEYIAGGSTLSSMVTAVVHSGLFRQIRVLPVTDIGAGN